MSFLEVTYTAFELVALFLFLTREQNFVKTYSTKEKRKRKAEETEIKSVLWKTTGGLFFSGIVSWSQPLSQQTP